MVQKLITLKCCTSEKNFSHIIKLAKIKFLCYYSTQFMGDCYGRNTRKRKKVYEYF